MGTLTKHDQISLNLGFYPDVFLKFAHKFDLGG